MKARQLITIAVATATLAMSTASFARDDDRRGGHRDGHRAEYRHVERHHGPKVVYRHVDRKVIHHAPRVIHQPPRYVHRDVRIVHRNPGYQGYGPRHHRGQYIPREYRDSRYVVRHHNPRLYQPPRGHQWIQVNGEFLLVAAATGLIAHVLLNN